MKKNRWIYSAIALTSLFALQALKAQIPDGYYSAADGKSGYELKTALHNIIKTHTQRSYTQLWTDFYTTDARANGKVWDMYSNYEFAFGDKQCGNYSKEGDCYNREHSFPKSWFGDATPMYTDLFHLYPTDGYVNSRRSNNPFGEVSNPTYTSKNGSKLGPNTTSGFSGTVFEPVDEYKGDFARTYFYMATCYEDKIASWSQCQTEKVCDGSSDRAFTDWTAALLLKWHRQDPVSDKETARNNAVYNIQGNRNPFIDHPEWVEAIWGESGGGDDPEQGEDPGEEQDPDPGASGSDSILLVEDFENFDRTDDNSTPGSDFSDCDGVQNIEGWWAQAKSGIRMASNSAGCTVTFNTFNYSGTFNVVVEGKGYSSSKCTATLICSECEDTAKSLTFTHYKEENDYGDGVYETLEPIAFTTANGKNSVTLKVSTNSGKQIFLGKIKAVGTQSEDGGQDPDPGEDPDPGQDPGETPEQGGEVETSPYYQSALGKARYELKTALYHIIKQHDTLKYDDLWEAFEHTDRRADGYVWDFYTNCDLGFDIHTGAAECGGINREHSFPKSWFGCSAGNEDKDPAATDLHHLYPTDAYFNSRHNNNPYAEVETSTARFVSSNGTMDGYSITDGYTGRAFEVIDEYKGDIARTYFYMMTAYQDRAAGWESTCPVCNGTSEQGFSDWYLNMLLKWHQSDPVSEKERKRNDSVYRLQHNRNPYIDHPELVDKIWGGDQTPFGQAVDIRVPYIYKTETGEILRRDTLYITHPENNRQDFEPVEDDPAIETHFIPETLLNESFEIYTRTSDEATTQVKTNIPSTIDSVSGIVYEGCNGVRLGKNDTMGALHFKPVPYSGSFKLLINGKGYSAKKLTATVGCKECEVKEKTVIFTQYKGKENTDSTLAVGYYQSAEPILFNTEEGAETVTLTVTAAKGKQVFISKVVMQTLDSIYLDPSLYITTTFWDSLTIESPKAGEEWQRRAMEAALKLTYKANSKMREKKLCLPKIALDGGKNYILEASLYNNQTLLGSQSVAFSTKKGSEEPAPAPDTVKAPEFIPYAPDSTFADSAVVSISCATDGALIYYSVDNLVTVELYTRPVVLYESDEVEAFAVKEGMVRSETVRALYTVAKTPDPEVRVVATPTLTPDHRDTVYKDSVEVFIACETEYANLWYSLDGTRPYIPYDAGQAPLTLRETTVLRAMATKSGWENSDIAVAYYEVELTPQPEEPLIPVDTGTVVPVDTGTIVPVDTATVRVGAPVFSLESGATVDSGTLLSLNCTPDTAQIYYTLTPDGTPNLRYAGPLVLTADTTHVAALAMVPEKDTSEIIRAVYYLTSRAHDTTPDNPDTGSTLRVKAPVFSLESGSVVEKGDAVTLLCETEGAKIYYCRDWESEPSTIFRKPITLTDDTTYLSAWAMIQGEDTSEIVRAVYYLRQEDTVGPGVANRVREKTVPFELYPNPATGEFTVEAPQGSRVEIFSASGVSVFRKENYSGREVLRLNTSGTYLIKVTDRSGNSSVKRLILR